MTTLKWHVSKRDGLFITRIVERAKAMFDRQGIQVDGLQLHMDLTALHANGCPLNLREFADADEFNFAHDIGGITQHMDRNTGKVRRFMPRFAQ